jgi:hypothetical protein
MLTAQLTYPQDGAPPHEATPPPPGPPPPFPLEMAKGVLERFLEEHCESVIPRNVIFVVPPHLYLRWDNWTTLALYSVGFDGLVSGASELSHKNVPLRACHNSFECNLPSHVISLSCNLPSHVISLSCNLPLM